MMTISTQERNGVFTIHLPKVFDFTKHVSFKESYNKVEKSVTEYILDFSVVEYIDSSALGMMLLLHEHASASSSLPSGGRIKLKSCTNEVKAVLEIANLDALFEMS